MPSNRSVEITCSAHGLTEPLIVTVHRDDTVEAVLARVKEEGSADWQAVLEGNTTEKPIWEGAESSVCGTLRANRSTTPGKWWTEAELQSYNNGE